MEQESVYEALCTWMNFMLAYVMMVPESQARELLERLDVVLDEVEYENATQNPPAF